jgi:hypothetical protein
MESISDSSVSAIYNESIFVWQWDACFKVKNFENYYVVAMNAELERMQGAERIHVECIVDDFGNLVRAA